MVPLKLDYQRNTRPFAAIGFALLAAGLLLLVYAVMHYRALAAESALWEVKAGVSQTAPAEVNARSATEISLEIGHANEVLHKLGLPWDQLFNAIESSSSKQIALLAMEPDAEKRVVKISGEAKDIGAVLDYIRRLSAQQVLRNVYLQSHQIQLQDPEKPVRFVLLASWVVRR